MDYCILAFASTHTAMATQKLLKDVCPTQTIPVPREISASCGIALRLAPEHLSIVQAALYASSLSQDEYALWTVTELDRKLYVEQIQ